MCVSFVEVAMKLICSLGQSHFPPPHIATHSLALFHYVVLAEDAIKAALNDYKVKQGSGGSDSPENGTSSN